MKIVSKPDLGTRIASENGTITDLFQNFFDDLEEKLNTTLFGAAVILPVYTVATLPSVSDNTNGAIIVSDETGGRTIATSDGTNWRRTSDGAIVS